MIIKAWIWRKRFIYKSSKGSFYTILYYLALKNCNQLIKMWTRINSWPVNNVLKEYHIKKKRVIVLQKNHLPSSPLSIHQNGHSLVVTSNSLEYKFSSCQRHRFQSISRRTNGRRNGIDEWENERKNDHFHWKESTNSSKRRLISKIIALLALQRALKLTLDSLYRPRLGSGLTLVSSLESRHNRLISRRTAPTRSFRRIIDFLSVTRGEPPPNVSPLARSAIIITPRWTGSFFRIPFHLRRTSFSIFENWWVGTGRFLFLVFFFEPNLTYFFF